jgi:hypothetical protein
MDSIPISILPSKIIAILVGINEYNNYPHLRGGVDADKIKDFLITKYQVPETNITLIKDEKATRETIIGTLTSLQNDLQRNNAILFFFSGYYGKTKDKIGMICPVDMVKGASPGAPGISAPTLVQLFDNIAKTRGNNITVFLDCQSSAFTWRNPSSFVVVTPKRVTHTNEGGAFTKSLINVLGSEKENLRLLTVQSFADKIQADLGVDVHCHGQNIDCLLFNPEAGKAHHAFISGKTEKDGSITLAAGEAHGVQKDATYVIYPSNMKANQNKRLGYLHIRSANVPTTSTLHFENESYFSLPPVFYAVETSFPGEMVKIFSPTGDIAKIEKFPSWELAELIGQANVTLKFADGYIRVSWNGVVGDPEHMREIDPDNIDLIRTDDRDYRNRIVRMIRDAARFTYHISRPSPEHSSILNELRVELREVGAANVLNEENFVELTLAKGKMRGPFYLNLHNHNNVPVWPFIFICEPASFSILPWYSPPSGTIDPPLEVGKTLTVGLKNEDGLLFRWRQTRHVELSYINIFVTTERTSFSSLIQYGSPTDYELREVDNPSSKLPELTPGDTSGNPHSPSSDDVPRATALEGAKWATMRITIKRKYVEEVKTDDSSSTPVDGSDSDSDYY